MGVERIEATLTAGEFLGLTLPSHWGSCSDLVGCEFRGMGRNEGPACAAEIEGVVRFADGDGNQIFDEEGRQDGAMFWWRTDPKPDALFQSGEPFNYVTTGRVPPDIVSVAARYVSFVTTADLSLC